MKKYGYFSSHEATAYVFDLAVRTIGRHASSRRFGVRVIDGGPLAYACTHTAHMYMLINGGIGW